VAVLHLLAIHFNCIFIIQYYWPVVTVFQVLVC